VSTELKIEPNICSPKYDGIVLVSGTPPGTEEPEPFKSVLFCSSQLDSGLFEHITVLPINLPSKRLIYCPTGSIDPDYDDVRVFNIAAVKGIKR
jgi:leucyl aminopeptidase